MTSHTAAAPFGRSVRRHSAFRQLAVTNWREMYRDPKTLFFSMIFPFIFLAMFAAMGSLMDSGAATPHVTVSGSAPASVSQALQNAHIDVVPSGSRGGNLAVTVTGDHATVRMLGGATVSRNAVVSAIASTGVQRSAVQVLTTTGADAFDPLRSALPTVLMIGLLSIAFLGTAGPLVGLRQRGTLRLIGTTPVRRLTFIGAQSPARLLLGLIQVAIIAGYAYGLGYLRPADIGPLLITSVLGLAMVLSFGYLLASRMTSQDLATTVGSLLIPIAMLFAGSILPPELLPAGVRGVTEHLPTSVLSDSLGVSLVGGHASLMQGWLTMLLITVVTVGLTAAIFSWDQGGKR